MMNIGRFLLGEKMSLKSKGMFMVFSPLLLSLSALLMISIMLRQAELAAIDENRSKTIITLSTRLQRDLLQSTSSLVTRRLTSQDLFAAHYDRMIDQTEKDLSDLLAACAESNYPESALKQLKGDIERILKETNEIRNSTSNASFIELATVKEKIGKVFFETSNAFSDARILEEREFKRSKDRLGKSKYYDFATKLAVFFGVCLNIIMASCLAHFFGKSISSRFAIMVENTHRLSARKELCPVLSGSDELCILDRSFHEMAAAITEMEQLKRDFVNMISHDLRSPLTALKLFLEVLSSGCLSDKPDQISKRANLAQASVNRLISLVNNLLDAEKLEAGQMQLNLEVVSVKHTALQAIKEIKSLAEKKSIELNYVGPRIFVLADSERLIQILVNLISNAIKFSPEGGCVTIDATTIDKDVEISVSDQGRGISEEQAKSLFSRFKQVNAADGKRNQGTGLGLSICKALCEQMGGSIGVKSEIGKGASFWFRLPEVDEV